MPSSDQVKISPLRSPRGETEPGFLIGDTPLYPLNRVHPGGRVSLFAKLEWRQFGGSVKARPAWQIVKDALDRGELHNEKCLLDASSGNTGIAYGHIGAALGFPVTLCIPENASGERIRILEALGVNLRSTPGTGGTEQAREIARQMHRENPDRYFYADQYNNPSNPRAHYRTTAPEILEQTDGRMTHFVAGLGTTGTFTGTGRRLREHDPEIRLVGLQPGLAMHGLEGWKHLETASVPGIYDPSLPDRVEKVSTEEAHTMVKRTARTEGLLLSPSSGANLAGALRIANELEEGVVVTIFPDKGSKYGETLKQLF